MAYSNYKNLEGVERLDIPAWRGVVIRMMYKFSRLEEFCVKEELAVKDETIEDTFKDIAIYSVLSIILYRKRIAGASNDPDIMDWRFLATIHSKRKAEDKKREAEQALISTFDPGCDDDCLPSHELEYRPEAEDLNIVKEMINLALEEQRKLMRKIHQLKIDENRLENESKWDE